MWKAPKTGNDVTVLLRLDATRLVEPVVGRRVGRNISQKQVKGIVLVGQVLAVTKRHDDKRPLHELEPVEPGPDRFAGELAGKVIEPICLGPISVDVSAHLVD